MKIKILSTVLIILFVFTYTESIYAVTQADVDALNKKKNEAQAQLNQIQSEKTSVKDEVEILSAQLRTLNNEIDDLKNKLDELNNSISQKEKEITQKEKEIEEKSELLKKRLIAMYKNGGTSYLDVLLGSSSYLDMLSSYDVVEKIANADTQLINQISNQKTELETSKSDLENQKKEVDTVKAEKDAKNVELTQKQSEKQTKLNQLSADEKAKQAERDQFDAEAKKADAAIRAAEEEAKKNNGGSGSGSGANIDNSRGTLGWPLPAKYDYYAYITSYFGPRKQPTAGASTNHGAIDIGVSYQPVYAAEAGVVLMAQWVSGYGNFIMIWHKSKGELYTAYGHLSQFKVSAGQTVSRGQQIAVSGNTGVSTGPHLHFEVRSGGSGSSHRVDPLNYVPIS